MTSRHTLLAVLAALLLATPALAQDQGPTVRVCAGGDMMLGSNLQRGGGAPAERAAPDSAALQALVAPLVPLFADAQLAILNVEGAIGSGPAPRKCSATSTSCYAFRQPIEAAFAFRTVAPNAAVIGGVANNHAMDAGRAGWQQTATHLGAAGVFVTGMDTLPTMIPVAEGDSVAVLAFSTFSAGPDARNLAAVQRHVARAAARTRRVVVAVHHGAEGPGAQRTADRVETAFGENRGNPVAFARTAVDAGASLVVGHGPHVLRAAEWRGNALVFYSLGNLLTNGSFSVSGPSGRGAVACADITAEGRAERGLVRSTRQLRAGQLIEDPEGRGAWLIDSLGQLDFPASAARVGSDGQVLRPQRAEPSVPPTLR